MKKTLLLIAVLLTSTASAGDLDGFYPVAWICGEYTDLNFSVSDISGEADYRTNIGFGLSIRIPTGISGIQADLGGYGTGYNFSKWEIDFNLTRKSIWNIYILAGPNFTFWSFRENLDTNPGFGFQIGLERVLSIVDESVVTLRTGYKYNTGQLEVMDIGISSNSWFFRIGAYMEF